MQAMWATVVAAIRQALTEGWRPSEDKLVGSEGVCVKAYLLRLEMRRNVGWTWVEPEGATRWLTYAPQVDWDSIFADAHGSLLGGHLGASRALDMVC